MPSTPVDQLRIALAADSARPFTTFYDDATGERVELSVATFDNWVAKTANLLRDDLAVEPGARVSLLLPAHWQTQVWLLAAWSLGLVVSFDGDPADADVVVSGPDTLDRAATCPGERVALALRPMGGRFPTPPAGFLDYAAEVAGHGDRFVAEGPVRPDAAALAEAGREWTAGELAEAGEAVAREWKLVPGDRLLTSLSFARTGGLQAGVLAPLAASVPVVVCRHLDESLLERRIEAERVTRAVTRSAD